MNLPDHLRKVEEFLLRPTTGKTPRVFVNCFADEFREYGSSGRTYTKTEILE